MVCPYLHNALNAQVRVVRVSRQRHGDGYGYEIGAVIQQADDGLLDTDDPEG